mgnify:CR=1 FL=1
MNYDALDDYIHALRARRDFFSALNKNDEADRYDRYADAIAFPVRSLRHGTKLTPDEASSYLRDLLGLSAPDEIQARVASHRCNAVYQAVMKLANAMQRLKDGKPARKLLGVF